MKSFRASTIARSGQPASQQQPSLQFARGKNFAGSQVESIFTLSKEPWRTFFILLTMTGCAGEALGLQWGDVDFDHLCIHTRRSGRYGRAQCTKSEGSAAPIRLPGALSTVLAEYKVNGKPNPEGFIFDRWRAKSVATSRDPLRTRTALLFCILLSGCGLRSGAPGPSIEFTRVPPAAEGGRDKLDIIEGRVTGASPGQQIVLYAKSGTWWVQPLANETITTIETDSKWINSTHLGTEYAALLVEPGYRPAATTSALPVLGDGVVAVAIAKGGDSAVSKTLSFSGYEWRIREAPSDRGGINFFNASNAWTDADGALHMRIANREGHWTCAEVILTRNLGYGTYSFVVRDTSHLEPPVVLSMFTWDYGGASQNHREMDIEISEWGDPTSKNAQYVVQPFFIPENASRFMLPGGVMTHSFRWEPGRVSFKTVRGAASGGRTRPVAEHVFTSGVPSPGIETLRINLYVFGGAKNPLRNGTEVVVEKFEYLP